MGREAGIQRSYYFFKIIKEMKMAKHHKVVVINKGWAASTDSARPLPTCWRTKPERSIA